MIAYPMIPLLLTLSVLSGTSVVLSETIIFNNQPSHAQALQHEQYRSDEWDYEAADISQVVKYHGLTTFAHLPYDLACLDKGSKDAIADIVIIGAPFDTGVSAKPGARYGPSGIRTNSQRIEPESDYNEDGFNALKGWATIIDCGDVPMLPFDNRIALAQLQRAHELILARGSKNTSASSAPRIITLGGDHTITLPALRAASKTHGPVTVLHFDSHIDTWSPLVLGDIGGSSRYAGVNHGTWAWHAHHERLLNTNNLHVGIRAPYSNPKEDLETDKKCGFEIITAKAIDRLGVAGIISAIRARMGNSKVYLSVDIDVLDPAFAPEATGTPEPGGYSTRELLAILDGLEGLNIIGADVVEVAPAYDGPGEITSLAGSSIVHSIVGLLVKYPVQG